MKVRAMGWWRTVAFPVRSFCLAIAARIKTRKTGGGLPMLHSDVQTSGYEDVQVMWEMLRKSKMKLSRPASCKRPFWRAFSFSNHHLRQQRACEAME